MVKIVQSVSLCLAAGLAGILLAASNPASALTITLGDQDFSDGATPSFGQYKNAASSGDPAPFDDFIGNDQTTNFSAAWTFNFAVDTYVAATLTFGIFDHDSAAPGDQVASFTLDAIHDSTATLNAMFNAADEGTQQQVDVYTVDLSGFLGSFSDGMAIFSLVLQGPARGNGPGSTHVPKDFNGAGLDFATLNLTPEIPVNDDVPEPATMGLFVIGLAGLGFARRRRRAIP